MRRWLVDRGWVNYGGKDGTYLLDEDGPIFTVAAAVSHEEAGRPELPKQEWVAPVDAPRTEVDHSVVDPWDEPDP